MSAETKETVGLFGGSFDPPHVAHVLVAAYVLSAHPIDRLLVVPNHRHALDKSARASFEHRIAMCELAVADLNRAEVSAIEGRLGGTSRTLHTLEALREEMPDSSFRLVIGADLLSETDRWYAYDKIVELAPPLVVGRLGYDEKVEGLQMPRVSSTEVRSRLAEGRSVEGLVPNEVAHYAREHSLYRRDA